jgi:hypothetical protein
MNCIFYKSFSLCRFTVLLVCILLVVSNNYSALAQTAARESQKPGRKKTMNEQTNPNIGKKFPAVNAESLANTRVSIPDSAKGKVALIAVAFLRESQPQLDSWLGPFAEKFGNRQEYTFYEVPMLSSGYKFMRFMIDGGMRSGIPKEKHKNVVTMYGDVEKYMNALSMDLRYGYAFLLDGDGVIRWQGQKYSTQDTLKELFDMAEKLSKN